MRRAVGCLSVIFLAACSPSQEHLRFSPDDGEVRRYQVQSETFMSMDTSYGKNSERVSSLMLTDYKVHDEGDYRVELLPVYMSADFGRNDFASSRESDGMDQELRDIMSAGFTIIVDHETGAIKDFSPNSEAFPDDISENDPLLSQFRDELTSPGFAQGIELREGATTRLKWQDEFPEVTLTVKRLTDEEVVITAESGNDQGDLFGVMVMERDTGWMTRATLIIDAELDEPGVGEGEVRSVMHLAAASWPYGMDIEYLNNSDDAPQFDDLDLDEINALESSSEAKVLASDTGYIDHYRDRLVVNYPHEETDYHAVGRVTITDAKPYTVDGEPLDLELQLLDSAFTTTMYEQSHLTTSTEAFPLGWQTAHEQLNQLGYVEAEVSWYPQEVGTFALPVDADGSEVTLGDAKAVLKPTDNPQVFHIFLQQGEHTEIGSSVGGVDASRFRYHEFEDAPDWLSKGEAIQLAVSDKGSFPSYIEVYFEDELPDEITLMSFQFTEQPAATRRVKFYEADAIHANPRLSAPTTNHLYPNDIDTEIAAMKYVTHPVGELELETFNRPQLHLVLTAEQVALCDVQLTTDTDDLVWREMTRAENQPRREQTLRSPAVMRLESPDGRRFYFYDQEVTTQVTCPADYEWQPVDWQPEEDASWLVNIDELPGVQEDWPLSKLLREFQFRDSDNRPLALVPPMEANKSYYEAKVGEYLVEETYLRVAGKVNEIVQLQATGEPVEQNLNHRFPDLPDLNQRSETE